MRRMRWLREDNVWLNLAIGAAILISSAWAFAEEQGPFHPCPPTYERPAGPQPAHPRAPECAVDDRTCVRAHDGSMLDTAYHSGWSREEREAACRALSTTSRELACLDAVRMIDGDAPAGRVAQVGTGGAR